MPPAEAPAAAQPDEQDLPGPRCCPQTPGNESGKQIPKGARGTSPLSEQSSDAGAKAKETHGPAADPAVGPGEARTDTGEDAAALGPHPDKGPGAGGPQAGEDCPPEGLGGAEAGSRASPGAQAGSLVLGKCGRRPVPMAGGFGGSAPGGLPAASGERWCGSRGARRAGDAAAEQRGPWAPLGHLSKRLSRHRCRHPAWGGRAREKQVHEGHRQLFAPSEPALIRGGEGWSGAALLPVPMVREASCVLVPQALLPLLPWAPRWPCHVDIPAAAAPLVWLGPSVGAGLP